ncbi:hypothetical protein pb186bvf_007391 [Paramecium bursaria]
MQDQEPTVPCDQCKDVPDNYLSLNCGHSFCLMCMAQNFIKVRKNKNLYFQGGRIYKLEGSEDINYICSLCDQETQLDEASQQAIEGILKDLLLPQINKIKEDQPPTPSNCEIHGKEETNLFCFSCESRCFCVKCLLKHENTHDIVNVGNSLKKLRSKMNEATHTIGASLELLQLQLKRLRDQESTQTEELDYMLKRIGQQFQQIYQCLRSKEQEMLGQLGTLKDIQIQQTDKLVGDIQVKINSLQNLRNDFENIGLSESLQPSVSLLNYYSECKQIMQKVLGQLSFSDIFYQQPQLKYFPDSDQFFKIDDFEQRITQLKLSIDRLMQPQRSFSQHEKQSVGNQNQPTTQRAQTQMDESTDSFKCVSVYSKMNTPLNHQSRLQAKVEEIKNLYSERIKTQQKIQQQDSNQQRSMSDFKKQSALSALRLQQGLFDSRITKKK